MNSQKPGRARRNLLLGGAAIIAITAGVVTIGPPEPEPESAAKIAGVLLADGFEGDGGGGGPVDPCSGPLVAPVGWVLKEKAWVAAFSAPNGVAKATYPNSVGSPVPVPGFEVWRPRDSQFYLKGQIVAIPFEALPDTAVRMSWDTAQANQPYGYGLPRPAGSMFVRISPCRWDVSPDPKCSRLAGLDSLFYSSREASGEACRVEAGRRYYINVVMANPLDGLTLGEHTCQDIPRSAEGCDVQMTHRGN